MASILASEKWLHIAVLSACVLNVFGQGEPYHCQQSSNLQSYVLTLTGSISITDSYFDAGDTFDNDYETQVVQAGARQIYIYTVALTGSCNVTRGGTVSAIQYCYQGTRSDMIPDVTFLSFYDSAGEFILNEVFQMTEPQIQNCTRNRCCLKLMSNNQHSFLIPHSEKYTFGVRIGGVGLRPIGFTCENYSGIQIVQYDHQNMPFEMTNPIPHDDNRTAGLLIPVRFWIGKTLVPNKVGVPGLGLSVTEDFFFHQKQLEEQQSQ